LRSRCGDAECLRGDAHHLSGICYLRRGSADGPTERIDRRRPCGPYRRVYGTEARYRRPLLVPTAASTGAAYTAPLASHLPMLSPDWALPSTARGDPVWH